MPAGSGHSACVMLQMRSFLGALTEQRTVLIVLFLSERDDEPGMEFLPVMLLLAKYWEEIFKNVLWFI